MRFEGRGQFWEIEQRGDKLVTRTGEIGTRGQAEEVEYVSRADAALAHDRAIAARLADGYGLISPAPPPPPPPSDYAELTAAICEHRDDPGASQVFADWLIAQGHPFGELVVLMQLRDPDEQARQRRDELFAQAGLPPPDRATYGWRHGLWSWLRIDNANEGCGGAPYDPVEEGQAAFEHPACAALEELRIASLRWRSNSELVPRLLFAAGSRPWARYLERLHVGDFDHELRRIRDPDVIWNQWEWDVPRVGALVSQAFPGLRSLHLLTPGRELDPLELPRLAELSILGHGVSMRHLDGLVGSSLPALERLVLQLDSLRLAEAIRRRTRALFASKRLPMLRRLGLVTEDASGLLAEIVASPLGARLERLELTSQRLADGHAAELAAGLRRLPKLAVVVLEGGPGLTAHGFATLEGTVQCQVWRAGDPRLQSAAP